MHSRLANCNVWPQHWRFGGGCRCRGGGREGGGLVLQREGCLGGWGWWDGPGPGTGALVGVGAVLLGLPVWWLIRSRTVRGRG